MTETVHWNREALTMLNTGARVPHFTVTTLEGGRVAYGDLWQRRNLLLVVLPGETSDERSRYVAALAAASAQLTTHETALVITADTVEGLTPPSVLVADRWGEISQVTTADAIDALPAPAALVESLRFVQHECPECQGETR